MNIKFIMLRGYPRNPCVMSCVQPEFALVRIFTTVCLCRRPTVTIENVSGVSDAQLKDATSAVVRLARSLVCVCAVLTLKAFCLWREQAALSKQLAKDGEESYVFQIVDEVKSFLSMLKDKVWPVPVALCTSTSLFS